MSDTKQSSSDTPTPTSTTSTSYPWEDIVDEQNNDDALLLTHVERMDKLQESYDQIKKVKKLREADQTTLKNTQSRFENLKSLSNRTFDDLNAQVTRLKAEITQLKSTPQSPRFHEIQNYVIHTCLLCISRQPKLTYEALERRVRREVYTFLRQRVKVVNCMKKRQLHITHQKSIEQCIAITKSDLLDLISMYCRATVQQT